ncbi:hypothetical protein UlMin_011725 [Ulmus minor]
MEEDEPLPDHLRCNRTDGRQWRCKRRVKDNLKLCEIHYLQGRHRQYKEKVPESLKLQRKAKSAKEGEGNGDKIRIRAKKSGMVAKIMKRKRPGETLKKMKKLKRGDTQLELIRMVLKREAEKSKNKKKNVSFLEENSEGELTRDLPNGRMAISSSSPSSPRQLSGNVVSDSPIDVKVGVDLGQFVPQRRFRSKNIEALPIGKLQVLPFGRNGAKLNRAKKKKCHWCQRSLRILTKCSSCQKLFFCLDCIKERYFDTPEEVKMACPVCRKTCTCKNCLENQSNDTKSKDLLGDKQKVEEVLYIHYLICMLLPVLKQIQQDQNGELETEAKMKEINLANLHIKQAENGLNDRPCCNKCKGFILDLHRSCPNCSYNLCLCCCRGLYQENFHGDTNMSLSKCSNKKKTHLSGNKPRIENKLIRTKRNPSSKYIASSGSQRDGIACNVIGATSCPSMEFGGCGETLLELRCIFPLSWIKELEESAEEIVCSYDFPDTSDISSCCPLCPGTDQKAQVGEQLQEAALRENSNDNLLYYPTLVGLHGDNLEHFQKHWLKGHPVIVRNVLQTTLNLSWDPVLMFCSYLEGSISRYENNRDLCEPGNCLDWCEVEIGIKQCYIGSLKGQTHTNTWNETLKFRGWLSSQLFEQQFPAHYDEIIRTLPLQKYTNPASGLLNLVARLPQEIPKPDLGPFVYVSYGYSDQHLQTDSVINLCYDSFDMVNILAHTSDVPISAEQLSKVRKLLKKHKAQTERESSDHLLVNKVEQSSLHGEEIEESGEDIHLRKKVASVSFNRNLKENSMPLDEESDSGTDSDPLLPRCTTRIGSEKLEDKKNCGAQIKKSNHDRKKSSARSSGAQWDVFRRQDVPKLIEYLRRHVNEFSHTHELRVHEVHPILDKSFFLDATHKKRLKKEFKIEPWTFEQQVGEAVIIPAGCPYQIRSPKSCVHVMLDFMSPENVTQCIKLADEIRLLPEGHQAKVDKLEVKRIAVHSISRAVKEIRELTRAV